MDFKIITAFDEDGGLWDKLVEKLSPWWKDIHLLREYGLIYSKTYNYLPFLVFYGNDKNFIIQPYVKRPLNQLPFLLELDITEPFFDISNPYGFGGPFFYGDSETNAQDMFKEFYSLFSEYCCKEKIASEFTSLHPLKYDYQIGLINNTLDLYFQKQVVYIKLSSDNELLWKGIRKGHKSSIKKAINSGVVIKKVDATEDNFRIFNQLYSRTMKRNDASERWFFPDDYFQNCYDFLGENRVSLFFAFLNEFTISASIFIHDFNCIYYHFAGSDERYFDYCANNLLLFEVIKWAKKNGYTEFHLGGGVSSNIDDTLFIFKSGFSKMRAPLYTYHKIHNMDVYKYLSNLKIKYETMNGIQKSTEFFPLYRR